MRVIMILLFLTGCATPGPVRSVRAEDLEAWKGVPVIELEMHPAFSKLPIEKRTLSTGDELWILKNMHEGGGTNCYSGSYGDNRSYTNCSSGKTVWGCINQFVVSNGVVKEYRVLFQNTTESWCYTDCSIRPSSRPCLNNN